MQAGISLLLQFSLRLIAFLRYWPRTASRMTPSFKSKLEEQEAVLKSIAVEFQEAQCFFMLACQSAVLAVIKALAKDPQFLGTQTLRAVKYNLAMARLVHITGNLCPLHHPHRRHVAIIHLCAVRLHNSPGCLRFLRHSHEFLLCIPESTT